MTVDPKDIELLRRDKYDGSMDADMSADLARLACGEPLAYVIGWIPFLGTTIHLDSHSLIPRPETEYWTEKLIDHLQYRFDDQPFALLDLCAGSGAIGIAILKHLPNAHVTFGEIDGRHASQIIRNLVANGIDPARTKVRASDLFTSFTHDRFDLIAANPPYIPSSRILEGSVADFEPHDALFSGNDGMQLIRQIVRETSDHLLPGGELWMECDIDNIQKAQELLVENGAAEASIHPDQYGRSRYIVSEFE